MNPESWRSPPLLGTLDYLAEVAKDWARQRFAGAQRSDFTLAPQRFELRGDRVRRRRILCPSPEAESPVTCAHETIRPTAWCRPATVTLLTERSRRRRAFRRRLPE